MKRPKDILSVCFLIAANLVPLAGVFFWGWDATVIVLLYWVENVVAGFYNILRMAFLRAGGLSSHLGKFFWILIFCLHFGGFCGVHGIFLLMIFKIGSESGTVFYEPNLPGPLVFVGLVFTVIKHLWQYRPAGMELPVLCLFLSHGISFVQNYLVGGEYARKSMKQLMQHPYHRIVLLHITIIGGALPVMILGSPDYLLVTLVILKIILDIFLHDKSHREKADDDV